MSFRTYDRLLDEVALMPVSVAGNFGVAREYAEALADNIHPSPPCVAPAGMLYLRGALRAHLSFDLRGVVEERVRGRLFVEGSTIGRFAISLIRAMHDNRLPDNHGDLHITSGGGNKWALYYAWKDGAWFTAYRYGPRGIHNWHEVHLTFHGYVAKPLFTRLEDFEVQWPL